MIPIPIYFYILAQLLFISYVDLKSRKISNLWPFVNFLTFLPCLFIYSTKYAFVMDAFYYPIAFVLVGLLLFAMKIMGAGDTKYLASFFLLVPHEMQDIVFIHLVYTTIVVGVTLFAYNTIRNFNRIKSALILMDVGLIKGAYGKKFAYTPVICLTWIIVGILIWRNS